MSFIHECNLCQPLAELGPEAIASVLLSDDLGCIFWGKYGLGGWGMKENSLSCIMFSSFLIHYFISPHTLKCREIIIIIIHLERRAEAKTELKSHTTGR